MTFIFFILVSYALCYLVADARVFGVDATVYNEIYDEEIDPTSADMEWIQEVGVFRIRQVFLRNRLVREHMGCYFCMGVWAGPLAHTILWHFFSLTSTEYVFQHPHTASAWALGLLVTFLVGAPTTYVLNHLVLNMEAD